VRKAEVVEVREGNLFPSDHHPLVVELYGDGGAPTTSRDVARSDPTSSRAQ
jgi:hypothetical protein